MRVDSKAAEPASPDISPRAPMNGLVDYATSAARGPVRYRVDARRQAATRAFRHHVVVRPTAFRPLRPADPDRRVQFQELYDELIADEARNALICRGIVQAVRGDHSTVVLTERNAHPSVIVTSLLEGESRPSATGLAVPMARFMPSCPQEQATQRGGQTRCVS